MAGIPTTDIENKQRDYRKYFLEADYNFLKNKVFFPGNNRIDSQAAERLNKIKIRNPNLMVLVSFLGGVLGIDRFLIGDYSMGFLKLFTCGLFYIGWLIDIFAIKKQTKFFNAVKVINAVAPGSIKKPSIISRINPNDVHNLKISIKQFQNSFDRR